MTDDALRPGQAPAYADPAPAPDPDLAVAPDASPDDPDLGIEGDPLPPDEDEQTGDYNDIDGSADLPVDDPTIDQTEDDEDLG